MTEDQIEHLKTLLDDSLTGETSAEMDKAVLSAAHKQANRNKRQNVMIWLPDLSIFSSAAVAVILTMGIFLTLGKAISPEESTFVGTVSMVPNTLMDESLVPELREQIVRPSYPALPPMSAQQRDAVLMSVTLPDTQDLLEQMELSLNRERLQLAGEIRTALFEINALLESGDLNNARRRYDRLRRVCTVCQLPESLDALALSRLKPPARG